MNQPKIGVLLINLGTPENPSHRAIRRFLRPFLADPRVIDLPRWLWLPILHLFVLPFRPYKIRKLYQSIWTDQGFPLHTISQEQERALQDLLTKRGVDCLVQVGMLYGHPSLTDCLDRFWQAGVEHLFLLPLFPQYSASTTAAGFDAFAAYCKDKKTLPQIHLIPHYYQEPAYIEAVAQTIQLEADELLLFSFHGIPKRYVTAGDPYYSHCKKTAKAIADQLGLDDHEWTVAFQSRFGPEEWLTPYTDQTLQALAANGQKKIAVVCPGFATDCLETLEEINQTNRKLFLAAGGSHYRYIPALNARTEHITFLADVIYKTQTPADWRQP